MFANRYTAFVDACSLVGALKRNLLLSLAEAEFFRLRWSARVLDEVESAIRRIREEKGICTAADDAKGARRAMERAFEDAMVDGYELALAACDASGLPDHGDAHVLAAAIRTDAHVIVTENIRHFPSQLVAGFGMEVRTSSDFIADTIDLDRARAIVAIARMRRRLSRPGISADQLLVKMEAEGMVAAVDLLKSHVQLL
jgi:predicted nucleic acid-binding protein